LVQEVKVSNVFSGNLRIFLNICFAGAAIEISKSLLAMTLPGAAEAAEMNSIQNLSWIFSVLSAISVVQLFFF
jgi:hypothetical protein